MILENFCHIFFQAQKEMLKIKFRMQEPPTSTASRPTVLSKCEKILNKVRFYQHVDLFFKRFFLNLIYFVHHLGECFRLNYKYLTHLYMLYTLHYTHTFCLMLIYDGGPSMKLHSFYINHIGSRVVPSCCQQL